MSPSIPRFLKSHLENILTSDQLDNDRYVEKKYLENFYKCNHLQTSKNSIGKRLNKK